MGVSTLPRRVFHACNVLVINKRRVGIFRRMGEQFMERGTTVEYVRITSRPYIIIKRHGNAPNSGATSITLLLPSRLTSKSGRLVRSTPAIVFTRPSLARSLENYQISTDFHFLHQFLVVSSSKLSFRKNDKKLKRRWRVSVLKFSLF